MAKIYTLREVADIDLRKIGILNRFYLDVEGYTYRGLKNGTLFKYAKCSEVSIDDANIADLGANVCEALSTLDDKIDANSILIEANTSGLIKAKCLSIAFAIALG